MKNSDIITVCDKCFRASCWHGEFMCDEARDAGTTTRTVGQLKKLQYESMYHWKKQLTTPELGGKLFMKPEDVMVYVQELDKEISIKEFLKLLLRNLWIKEEQFSGKRPFGNSGWKCPIEKGLIENNFVEGAIDDDGYVISVDDDSVNKIILKMIEDF